MVTGEYQGKLTQFIKSIHSCGTKFGSCYHTELKGGSIQLVISSPASSSSPVEGLRNSILKKKLKKKIA